MCHQIAPSTLCNLTYRNEVQQYVGDRVSTCNATIDDYEAIERTEGGRVHGDGRRGCIYFSLNTDKLYFDPCTYNDCGDPAHDDRRQHKPRGMVRPQDQCDERVDAHDHDEVRGRKLSDLAKDAYKGD